MLSWKKKLLLTQLSLHFSNKNGNEDVDFASTDTFNSSNHTETEVEESGGTKGRS